MKKGDREGFIKNHPLASFFQRGEIIAAILNLKRKKGWGKFLRMSAAGQIFIPDKICISTVLGGQMLLSSPHGRVYGVPQKAFPSPE
ncbi:hypothetical protein [Methylicorpusculum sp.]|uniref:hypothetical protein n=1 Tax=Methylicorpusculum sp. TaxID=2713644 RepID=UPI00271FAE8C|nr:hypothetical protein [Methylicorpusculum sp.]MDO8843165.1 hypothetical protein [Methylicorpusculum sp.]